MDIIGKIKLIAETVTAISTAIIVVKHLWERTPKNIKNILEYIVVFFHGTKDFTGKKIYFCNAVKAIKEHKEQQQSGKDNQALCLGFARSCLCSIHSMHAAL